MRLAVRVQHRGLWICAEATCAGLVGAAGNRDCSLQVDVTRDQCSGCIAKMAQHQLERLVELLLWHLVVRAVTV